MEWILPKDHIESNPVTGPDVRLGHHWFAKLSHWAKKVKISRRLVQKWPRNKTKIAKTDPKKRFSSHWVKSCDWIRFPDVLLGHWLAKVSHWAPIQLSRFPDFQMYYWVTGLQSFPTEPPSRGPSWPISYPTTFPFSFWSFYTYLLSDWNNTNYYKKWVTLIFLSICRYPINPITFSFRSRFYFRVESYLGISSKILLLFQSLMCFHFQHCPQVAAIDCQIWIVNTPSLIKRFADLLEISWKHWTFWKGKS